MLNLFLSLILLSQYTSANTDPRGIYLRKHKTIVLCNENCDQKKQLKDKNLTDYQEEKAEDELLISQFSDSEIKFSLETIGIENHLCSIGGIAKKNKDGRYHFETPNDDQPNCTAELDVSKKSQISVTIKNCQSYCGARNSFSPTEVFSNKIIGSEKIETLDTTKLNYDELIKVANSDIFKIDIPNISEMKKKLIGADVKNRLIETTEKIKNDQNPPNSLKIRLALLENLSAIIESIHISIQLPIELKLLIEKTVITNQNNALKKYKNKQYEEALALLQPWEIIMDPNSHLTRALSLDKTILASVANDYGFIMTKSIGDGTRFIQFAIDLDPKRSIAHLNMADTLWDTDKDKAISHYQAYTKLSQIQNLPANVIERCYVCTVYEKFKNTNFVSKDIVGKWKSSDVHCTSGKDDFYRELIPSIDEFKKKTASEILSIDDKGIVKSMIHNKQRTLLLTAQLAEHDGQMLEQCVKMSEKNIVSNEKDLPCQDFLRKYQIKTENGKPYLKRETIDSKASWCKNSNIEWTFEMMPQ